MGRKSCPWYRTRDGAWYVGHEGRQVLLAKGPKEATAAEARQEFHRVKAGLASRKKDTTEALTVGALIEQFLEHAETERKPATFKWYRNVLKSFRAQHKTTPAASITAHEVLVWSRGYKSANYRRNNIAAVKAVFAWGRRIGLLVVDPVKDTPKPSPTRRQTIPTRAELNEVLAETDGTPLGNLLLFLSETGCRLQDARRIAAADVQWNIGIAVLKEHKSDRSTGKPKVIPLTDRILTMLKSQAARFPDGPLLRNTRDQPWTGSAVSQAVQHVRNRLGYGNEMTSHAIRHRYVTDAARVLPRNVVAALVGYQSVEMVDRIYDHTGDELAEDTAALRAAATIVSPSRIEMESMAAPKPVEPPSVGAASRPDEQIGNPPDPPPQLQSSRRNDSATNPSGKRPRKPRGH